MVLDGGKGSGRRKEDIKKIHDNWDLIFGKKDTPMIDEEDNEDYTNDDIDDGDEDCSWCGGCGEGDYDGASCRRCHGTGVEPRERDCDDHDFID
jgi:hypothetical protein